jgi:hypothetical protein
VFAAESHSTYPIEPSAIRSASLPKKKKLVKIGQRHPCFTSYVDVLDLEAITVTVVITKLV